MPPHNYALCPRDYYRGDPVALLAVREAKLRATAAARHVYWENQGYGQGDDKDCELCTCGPRNSAPVGPGVAQAVVTLNVLDEVEAEAKAVVDDEEDCEVEAGG